MEVTESAKLAREISPVESELQRQEKLIEDLRVVILVLGEKLAPITAAIDGSPEPDDKDSYGSSNVVRAISRNNNSIESIVRTVEILTKGVEV